MEKEKLLEILSMMSETIEEIKASVEIDDIDELNIEMTDFNRGSFQLIVLATLYMNEEMK